MHIAYLSPEYSRNSKPEGGLANYLYKVGQELTHRGHKVSILYLSRTNKFWTDEGVNVYEVKRFTFSYQLKKIKLLAPFLPALAQIYSAHRLGKALMKLNQTAPIDLVQASSYKSPGYTLRGNHYFPMVCRISSYAALIRSAEGRRRSFSDYLCDWLEIRQVMDSQAAFAPSQLMSDSYARLEGYRPSIIRTPLETVEIQMDDSCYKSNFLKKSYLLYFGTLKLVKGVDLLAEVLPPLLEKNPGLLIAFIGRDDGLNDGQKIFETIRNRNKSFEDRLIYLPALPKSSLYPVIAHSLGILMPSRMDNYPNACLEALFLGVPVVGTYSSSLDEMIVDGQTGFLAENGNPESIRNAIESLLALSSDQRLAMQNNIRAYVQSILAEDRVGQLIDFYSQAIHNFKKNGA